MGHFTNQKGIIQTFNMYKFGQLQGLEERNSSYTKFIIIEDIYKTLYVLNFYKQWFT